MFLTITPVNYAGLITSLQVIGILIPLLGLIILLRRENSGMAAAYIMISCVSSILLNTCYLFMLQSEGVKEASISLKMSYLANTCFYFFFTMFVFSYLKIKYVKSLLYIWPAIEIMILIMWWNGNYKNMIFDALRFQQSDKLGFYYVKLDGGLIYTIRYWALATLFLAILVYIILRFIRIKSKKERTKLIILACTMIVTIISLILPLYVDAPFDIIPFETSVILLVIILGVIKGGILNVTDQGRGWMFENVETAFIIVDSAYGYLDSNEYAKKLFPELHIKKINAVIPNDIKQFFDSEDKEYIIDDRTYEKTVTEIKQKDSVEGYCLMLKDVTEYKKLVEQLKIEKGRAEAANEAKSTFISNISHEIRTPMNAIVGMTEILLRRKMPDTEKGYLVNIKNSGNALLAIINDILDFSKIESGKMEIVESEYEPMSMLSDLGMMFLTRIGEKKVDLLFDIDEKLPSKLYGDALRIRQIIINIVNNAIKFTDEGYVKLTIEVKNIAGDEIELFFSIKDSGQGIKDEDVQEIFQSFQQVDAKKNHTKEGTGLGLSISQQLVELMGGHIAVHSIYGVGSEFYFSIKNKIVDSKKAAQLKSELDKRKINVSVCVSNPVLLKNIRKLIDSYGVNYVDITECNQHNKPVNYIITDTATLNSINRDYEKDKNVVIAVLSNPMLEQADFTKATVINKPFYSLNFCKLLNGQKENGFSNSDKVINFVAPKANVLIVDDNTMNLKVAVGLLHPLEMHIDTAESGKQAISMVKENRYDLIFMDHMMPVMDGVETTKAIRNIDDDYFRNVPIIALTANAVAGAREMFIQEGMNDFVAKPIEMKEICAKIKAWLPDSLIERKEESVTDGTVEQDTLNIPEIEGLNVAEGIKNSGSEELFINLLGDFYKLIDLKANKIEKCLADGLIKDYTVEVHALKNTSRMIGAMELSELFLRMEKYGNDGNVEALTRETPAVLKLYRSYKPILKPYGQMQEQNKHEVPVEQIIDVLEEINHAMDTFDLDGADEALKKLEEYKLPDSCEKQMELLRAYVADVAMEEVLSTTENMIKILKANIG